MARMIPWNKGRKGFTTKDPEKIKNILSGLKVGQFLKKKPNKTSFKKGHRGFKAQLGKTFSEEHRRKLSQHMLGHIPWNKDSIGLVKAVKGKDHPNWRGGITPINKQIRRSLLFRLWREAVYKRDNFTCQDCGIRGGKLHPHHIKSFAEFPELRFAIDNGLTLCENCHRKTDNFGGKRKK